MKRGFAPVSANSTAYWCGGRACTVRLCWSAASRGIGKSTLLLQMCQEMCKSARVLYVSGEESLRQIKLRAARLHISSPDLYILAETDMEQIISETELLAPDILIVDSIQTVYKRDLTAAPGGTTQIKECAMSLMQYAKNKNVTIFIVGHVNKEGTLAGPKILEAYGRLRALL